MHVGESARTRPAREPVRGPAQRVEQWCAGDARRLLLVTWLLAFAVLVLRRPSALVHAQFWAEDGSVFFHDQLLRGPLATLALPHSAGYLVVLQRLVADLAALFPSVAAPTVYDVCAFAIAAASIAPFGLPAYRYILRSDHARVLVVLLAASAPFADELIGDLTNVQWFLTAGGLLIVALPPRVFGALSMPRRAALIAVGVLVFWSSPLLLVALPVLVWQIVRRRGRALPACTLVGALAVELAIGWYAVHLPGAGSGPAAMRAVGTPGAVLALVPATAIAFAYRSVLTLMIGEPAARASSELGLVTPPIVALAAVGAIVAQLVAISRGLRRTAVLVALYLIAASIALALCGRGLTSTYARLNGIPEWDDERYFMLASFLTIVLVAMAAQLVRPRAGRRGAALASALTVAAFAAGIVANYRVPALRDLNWNAYAPAVDEWRSEHDEDRATHALAVPINPGGPWFLDLPATRP